MAERIYPSTKPTTTTNGGPTANPSFPATKSQLYGATRPTYRPQPHHRHNHRSHRRCCCRVTYYLLLTLLILLLLLGLSAVIFYLIYRPHRPTFTVTSLKLSNFNLSSSSSLTSHFDISLSTTNPNKNIAFNYNPTSITISCNAVNVGDGVVPSFEHHKKNTTVLKTTVSSTKQVIDGDGVAKLKSGMKSKSGLPLMVEMNTKVRVKMGGLKTPRVGIRVRCDGIKVVPPAGKKAATATTADAKCEVDVRVKIWKWTVG